MSAFLLPNAGGGQEPNWVRHGRLVYTYKRVVCVCLLVCLSSFYRPHEISYFAALPPSPRAGAVAGGPARAGKHAQREHAHARMPYNFSTKKS